MEYIQCPNCQHKYAVSDKLRTAEGRRIRCKHCPEIFEIRIQGLDPEPKTTPTRSDSDQPAPRQATPPAETAATEAPAAPAASEPVTETAAAAKPATEPAPQAPSLDALAIAVPMPRDDEPLKLKKRKPPKPDPMFVPPNPKSLRIASLGMFVLLAVTTFYLLKTNPELFGMEPPAIQAGSIGVDAKDPFVNLAKPLKPFSSVVRDMGVAPPARQPAPEPTAEEQAQAKADNERYSQPCQDAAAHFWISRFRLSHVRIPAEEYAQIFNNGVKLTNQIRKYCHDDSLVGLLTQSAVDEKSPAWIREEVILFGGAGLLGEESKTPAQ